MGLTSRAKFSLAFVLLLIIIPVVYAQQEDIRFYHEKSTQLNIREKCRINGAACDTSFDCFLTVLSPSQELIVDNETMQGPSVYYNYTLSIINTSVNGIHEATVDCDNSTDFGSNTFFYQVTPNGSEPIDEGQGLIILGGIILLIIIACSLGWMGLRFNNGAVGLSLIALSVLIFVFSIGMIANIFELSFGTFSGIADNYSSIYIVFIILATTGMLGLIIWLIVFSLKLYWKNRGIPKEAFES